MPTSASRLRAVVVGASAFVLLAVGAGGTLAASGPTTLYACYNTSGQVAVTDVNLCKLAGGGKLVAFDVVGATGPTGPIGPMGATGAASTVAGPPGATGATGATGAPGTGKVWFNYHETASTHDFTHEIVARLDLPAGKYNVTATGTVVDNDAVDNGDGYAGARCTLYQYQGGTPFAFMTQATLNKGKGSGAAWAAVSLSGNPTLTSAGPVWLDCISIPGSDHMEDVMLTAIQVDTITPQ